MLEPAHHLRIIGLARSENAVPSGFFRQPARNDDRLRRVRGANNGGRTAVACDAVNPHVRLPTFGSRKYSMEWPSQFQSNSRINHRTRVADKPTVIQPNILFY